MQRTEMCNHISLYIPPRRPIFDVIAQLRNEIGIVTNIKDESVRKECMVTLNKIIAYLLRVRETPANGMIIFSSPKEWHLIEEPAKPVSVSMYRCDTKFYTEHIPV